MTTQKTVIYIVASGRTSDFTLKFKFVTYSLAPVSFTYLSFEAYHTWQMLVFTRWRQFFAHQPVKFILPTVVCFIKTWKKYVIDLITVFLPNRPARHVISTIQFPPCWPTRWFVWYHLGGTSSGSWVGICLQGIAFVYLFNLLQVLWRAWLSQNHTSYTRSIGCVICVIYVLPRVL
jgi:hypothetical protein